MATLGVFQRARSEYEQPADQQPFGRILAAVMRGNAMVQGQSQAKDIASDQADSSSKMSVTITPNPSGGPPLVNLKNAPADMLNGTQQSDLEQAHDTPHANVEKKIAQMGIGDVRSAALKQIGYEPQTDAPVTPKDLESFRGAYRAQRDLGERPVAAALGAGLTKVGIFNKALLARDVNNQHALSDTAAYVHGVEPLVKSQAEVANLGTTARGQYLSTRNNLLDQKNINPANYGGSESEYLKSVNQALAPFGGLSADDTPAFQSAFKTARVSFLNDRLKEANTPEGRTAAASYEPTDEGFASWTRESVGVDPDTLDNFQRTKLRKSFSALQDQHVTDAIGTAKKEGTLGSFDSLAEAKSAYGLESVSGTKEKEFAASYNAARRSYQLADTRQQQTIDALRTKNSEQNEDVKAIADAITSGDQPPDTKGLYRLAGPVRAELARRGYNFKQATLDYQATQQHIKTINSTQQTRLRQAVAASYDQLDVVEGLYDQWKKIGTVSGVKAFNRASLAAAKNLPGDAGAAAQALEGQISLLTGELGNTLMGGNSPTDHALTLAQSMLQGDWNEQTFKKAVNQLRVDLRIRKNSLVSSGAAGLSDDSGGGGNTISLDDALAKIKGKK